ncbi:MAG: HAMP domain-containing sensor histidine kinase [Chitinophagales bacterium]|nr:HAMP domain-containing sensor histidine kinase [Chitinophagales bacterium]
MKRILSNPFTIFYIVFAYVISFSVWWAILLFNKNETAYREKLLLDKIQYVKERGTEQGFAESTQYKKNFSKYRRQKIMIVAEGAVFITLLVIGLIQVRRVFAKEIALAAMQRNFMLSVTHELKSPLSAIKASLQTFQKANLDPERKQRLIDNSMGDIQRLENLVDNILFAAKIDRGSHGLSSELINVSQIVESAAKNFINNKKNIKLICNVEPDIILKTDALGFASIVVNLIENAIKYSPENSEIDVVLKKGDEKVCLRVADYGIGIPDHEKNKIFEKFYRVGNEETRKTKGTGLGLYIVKRFVELFGGRIMVKDNNPRGTVFELEFKSA